jgi:hypothetical protein
MAVVWRVVVVVASGELAQDTSIKTKTESAEPSMIALFMMHYSFLLLTYNQVYIGYKELSTHENTFTGYSRIASVFHG